MGHDLNVWFSPPPMHTVLQHLRDFTLLKLKTNLASLLKQCEATGPGINRTGKSFHINHLCLFFLYFGPKNIWLTCSELYDTVSKINAQRRYMEKISAMTEKCVWVGLFIKTILNWSTQLFIPSLRQYYLCPRHSLYVCERECLLGLVDLKTHNNALFKMSFDIKHCAVTPWWD